jgi:glyoxylase-like metal-dependent hydrolase (beta-lactamase superfamily II)
MTIYTLDHHFRGLPGAIASYLIPHAHGAVLIESGPGSTLPALERALQAHHLTFADITDVLLTHIHLDHAGASGWLARQGARIHVHPVGAPHMLNPEKLLSSAGRIYGDRMQELWGDFLPVPEEKLHIVEDNEVIEIEGLRLRALDTPGHAYHHYAYIFEDVLFSGDVGAVRVGGLRHLRLPMPPPEFNPEVWRASLEKLQKAFHQGEYTRIAPTHFGVYGDPAWHLQAIGEALDEVEVWMLQVMPTGPSAEALRQEFLEWTLQRSLDAGLTQDALDPLEAANPSGMSADGIYRYWHKVRNAQAAP